MRVRSIAWVAGAALAVTGLAACGEDSGSSDGSELVIGEVAELTGAAEAVGGPQHNAIKLAVDEINAAGGIRIGDKKVRIKLRTEDTKSDPTVGVTAVQKLLTKDGVHYLVGSLSGAVASAYLPVIKDRKDIIDIVVGAANPGLNENISVYRPRADAFQSVDAEVTLALETAGELGTDNIAVLSDKKLQSNAVAVPKIVDAIKAAGKTVVGPVDFEMGATQFSSQIAALKRAGNKVALFQGYGTDLMTFVKQARAQGYDGTVVAASGATADQVKQADVSADALKNVFDIGTAFPADLVALKLNAEAAQKFADAYEKEFGAPPGYTSASAYGGVHILAAALEKAGTTTDYAKVREALDDLTVADVPELAEKVVPQEGDRIFKDHQAYFSLVLRAWDGAAWTTVKAIG
ncbi:hypothetical protein EFK50_11875 [Nocardioides marmoriginsengisoli]|uniref:Leucine-binding protein domain-containing protein n=1 Tax=Nocardioides marmoriginsengisoli TaxID=661483 RepID=A0A3N0CG78_9ACTN|nr:ABC transporter substrate-binding protein [Nocardioides marmoriginsengisoli]RNL62464.1 hypothetical protein EFK50_11875 [Nocardioides marmoriginsengisoli]